jgi:hypothetical protein
MRIGNLDLWRSPIVCWSCFIAFSVISFLSYRSKAIRPHMRPEELEPYLRRATIGSIIAALLAAAFFVLALRATRRRGGDHVG